MLRAQKFLNRLPRYADGIAGLPLRVAKIAAWQFNSLQHVLAERIRRLPFGQRHSSTNQRAVDVAAALRKTGVCILPQYLTIERLHELRKLFDDMIQEIKSLPVSEKRFTPRLRHFPPTSYTVDWHSEEQQRTQTRDPYKYSPQFLELAVDPFVLDVAEQYFSRPIVLQNADAQRLYPMAPRDFAGFAWHHDSRGRKLNVMYLFEDTAETDQRMTYLVGTHKLVHSLKRCVQNFYTRREIERLLAKHSNWRTVECAGPAGSLILFDGNGLHRGNRNLGSVRDSLMVRYMADQRHCWTQRIREADVARLLPAQQSFLRRQQHLAIG